MKFVDVTSNVKNNIKVVAISRTLQVTNGFFIKNSNNYFTELNLANSSFIVVI